MPLSIDITGQRFGRLVALRQVQHPSPSRRRAGAWWECQCDCGAIKVTRGNQLRAGKCISCGCAKSHYGPAHSAWRGGSAQHASGYRLRYITDEHPLWSMAQKRHSDTGYILEHRLVMAEALGRPLHTRETVHHINGDILDNRVENLQIRNGRHGKGSAYQCRACGSGDIIAVPLKGDQAVS